jgi:hypothetical protein
VASRHSDADDKHPCSSTQPCTTRPSQHRANSPYRRAENTGSRPITTPHDCPSQTPRSIAPLLAYTDRPQSQRTTTFALLFHLPHCLTPLVLLASYYIHSFDLGISFPCFYGRWGVLVYVWVLHEKMAFGTYVTGYYITLVPAFWVRISHRTYHVDVGAWFGIGVGVLGAWRLC